MASLGSLDECSLRGICAALGILGNLADLFIHFGTKATLNLFRVQLTPISSAPLEQCLVLSFRKFVHSDLTG